ncbi:hypothetical protein FB451DRAFT_967178, partial [Mycena latifolia]
LPSEPKIFHGRESELANLIRHFQEQMPRIAILGAGGMGKTSVARAAVHHPEIAARYGQHRIFVACDTASTSVQLAALIGAHVGLKQGNDLTRPVVHYFADSPPSLLILDNLETIWEPTESRRDLEDFLSLLTEVSHLALIITMRGAERPANVRWTRPFLEPLSVLAQDAARRTFLDIADSINNMEDVDKILRLTDNVPLVIDLMAHLVDYEGIPAVLTRWETERTALISQGYDRRSNLDLSISLSLASPRIKSWPHAQNLLSILAVLPDGLSDAELLQMNLPIDHIYACKASLLRTALAYTDDQRRLKTLVPIREYMQKIHPPMPNLIRPILRYFQELLDVYNTHFGTLSSAGLIARIASNFANIQSILHRCLNRDSPDL